MSADFSTYRLSGRGLKERLGLRCLLPIGSNSCVIFCIGFSACKKDAGEGGSSVIEGKVYEFKTWQAQNQSQIDTIYYIEDKGKDVFIIYSDDKGAIYDDNFETDFNGRYRFEFLRKGKYTIYTYADSTSVIPTSDGGSFVETFSYPIFRHVEIKSNNTTYKVDDFIIQKN